jgi:hypothetical protein
MMHMHSYEAVYDAELSGDKGKVIGRSGYREDGNRGIGKGEPGALITHNAQLIIVRVIS